MAQHIIDDLTLTKLLGKGSYGEVYLSKKKNSNKLFATKRINKAVADNKMRRYFEYEVKILSILNHPNIVKLEEVKKSQNNYYIVMEYVNGGELSKYLKKYKEKYQTKAFPEEIVQYLMKQILDALIYIHNLNIIHRDLKLENIMVGFDSEKDKEELNMMKAKIKIIDFGFAIILPSSDSLTNTAVGTLLYMDPKILEEFNNQALVDKSRGYGKEADIWSLGCICYELFRGKYPFEAETFDELVSKIRKGKYKLTPNTSQELVFFLDKMLKYDGKARLSAKELINEPFITKNVKDFTRISMNKIHNQKKDDTESDNSGLTKDAINKNYKKNNTFQGRPINDEYSFYSNNTNTTNNTNINRNNTYNVPVNFFGMPMALNNQPHMQNGLFDNQASNYPAPPPFNGFQNPNFINPGINFNINFNKNK